MNPMQAIKRAVPLFAAALLLTACGRDAQPQAAADPSKLQVAASFYPMYDFAVKIGGEKAEVSMMVPAGTEPHDWEPTAGDLARLEKADLFLYSGAGLESWADDVLSAVTSQSLISVEASRGIPLRSEEEHDGHSGHSHGEYDPHVWLNPLYAKQEMEHIKDGFLQADPENASYYEANYQACAAQFDLLDRQFSHALSPLPRKDVVVSHEAFGYLCGAYGLNQIAIDGLSPDSEPSPAKMAQIIDFIREQDVRVIFFEELDTSKVAEAVAEETGAAVRVLNPLEGLRPEEQAAGADYFSVMRENLAALEEALSDPPKKEQ